MEMGKYKKESDPEEQTSPFMLNNHTDLYIMNWHSKLKSEDISVSKFYSKVKQNRNELLYS